SDTNGSRKAQPYLNTEIRGSVARKEKGVGNSYVERRRRGEEGSRVTENEREQ
ncbi:hypothetical protein A2U01_0099141, partial [Trifolium medium]|nr:hypothetical protein [Trifolium medium]